MRSFKYLFENDINESNEIINQEGKNEFVIEDKSEIDITSDSNDNIDKLDNQNDIEFIDLIKHNSSTTLLR